MGTEVDQADGSHAQGTFYNYFASQQDLFDYLLPELGGELLDFNPGERGRGISASHAQRATEGAAVEH